MEKVFTTSYVSPDLDGVACAIAYAEFLNATGVVAEACLMGSPTIEAEFALAQLSVARPADRAGFAAEEAVIILDASEPIHFEGRLIPEQVVEVIDHRKVHEAHKFPNAKIQIEMVGAAATLVAEKFRDKHVQPSASTAQILQAAIISNTQNFQASTTTDRDHEIMQWLANIAPLPTGFIHDMFAAKSDFVGEKLQQAMDTETATFEIAGKRLGIVQLEMVGSDTLVSERKNEILEILERLKTQNKLNHIFLTILDIETVNNRLITDDVFIQTVLASALEVQFMDNVAVREGIIMRKEITPKIKMILEQNLSTKPA